LIIAANTSWLHYSEAFDDGLELLKAADRPGLEGVVLKRRDASYRAGKQCGWIKIKCATWREVAPPLTSLIRDATTRNNCGTIPRPTETGAHDCANEASTDMDSYQGQQIAGDHRDNTIARPTTTVKPST
jgi:hypothetical protein